MNEVEAIKEATVLQAGFARAIISAITVACRVIISEMNAKRSTGFQAGQTAKAICEDFGLFSEQILEHWEFAEKREEEKDEPET